MSHLDITQDWPHRFAEYVDNTPAFELPEAVSENLSRLTAGRLPYGDKADADQTDNMIYLLAKYTQHLATRLDAALDRITALEGKENV